MTSSMWSHEDFPRDLAVNTRTFFTAQRYLLSMWGIHAFLWRLVMSGSEWTSQSEYHRVHDSTMKEIEQNNVACTFVASVPTIFRQNGSWVKTITKHTSDPVSFTYGGAVTTCNHRTMHCLARPRNDKQSCYRIYDPEFDHLPSGALRYFGP